MAQNGSNVAPNAEEVGNTLPSSASRNKSTRDASKFHWIITLKASDGSDGSIYSWLQQHTDQAVWQVEKGDTTGYEHYQITMKLKVKQRLSWLKNHFAKPAHAEIVNNIDAAYDYSQKSDTRLRGPFYHPKPISKVKDPLDGKQYHPWQEEIMEIIKQDPDERTIHWYWEKTGNVGKSSFCKHLVLKYGAAYVLGKKSDIYHALKDDVRILLIDIPRTVQDFTPYEVIESVKNGMVFSGKYESRTKVFDPPHVFVFANFEPILEKVSLDRWHIREITM